MYQLSNPLKTLNHWQSAGGNPLTLAAGKVKYFYMGLVFDPDEIAYNNPTLADYANNTDLFNCTFLGYNSEFKGLEYALTVTYYYDGKYYKAVTNIYPALHDTVPADAYFLYPTDDPALNYYIFGYNTDKTGLKHTSSSTSTWNSEIWGSTYIYDSLDDLLADSYSESWNYCVLAPLFNSRIVAVPHPVSMAYGHASSYYYFRYVWTGGYTGSATLATHSDVYYFSKTPAARRGSGAEMVQDTTNVVTTTEFTYQDGVLVPRIYGMGYEDSALTTEKAINFNGADIFLYDFVGDGIE